MDLAFAIHTTMLHDLPRQLCFLGALLALSLASLWFLGFRPGLDIQGGTRLVYSVDIDQALLDGKISRAEFERKGRLGLLNDVKEIWLERLDPDGVAGIAIYTEGDDRLVIEMPAAPRPARDVTATLALDLVSDDFRIDLYDDPHVVAEFPRDGGELQIGAEVMRYSKRINNMLLEVTRAVEGKRSTHAAGAQVRLRATSPVTQLLENTGDLRFYIRAKDSDLVHGER